MTSIIESSNESVSQERTCNLDHSELMLQFPCKLVSCSGASINNQMVFVATVFGELLSSTRQYRVHYASFFLSAEQRKLYLQL